MAAYVKMERGGAQVRAVSARRRKRKQVKLKAHLALFVLFLLTVGAVFAMTSLFKIKEVRVTGTDKYDPGEMAAASGVAIGDNLLRIDKTTIERNLLEKYPYVESMEINRKMPPAIEISVVQCVPAGAVLQDGEVTLITEDGKVLEKGNILIPEDVPLVKGVETKGVSPGGYLEEAQAEKLVMLRYLLEAMRQNEFTEITNVDLSDRLNIRIIYENRIVLQLGSETELGYKLQFIKYALENEIGPEEKGVLDASTAHLKSRAVFSPSGNIAELQDNTVPEEAPEDLGQAAE